MPTRPMPAIRARRAEWEIPEESYAMSKTDVAWTFPTFAGYTKAQATCMTLTDGEWKNYGTHSPLS